MLVDAAEKQNRISLTAIVYGVYCALLPLNMILNFTGFTVNKYVGILASGLILIDIVRRHSFALKKDYVIYIIFLIWAGITTAWTVDSTASSNAFSTLFNLVMLTILGLIRGFNRSEIKLIKYFMIIPSAVLFFYLAPNLNVSYTRMTLQTSAGAADQNSLALNLVFPLIMAIDEFKHNSNKIVKVINATCILLMVISLLLIASRGGILSAALSSVIYFYLEGKKEGKNITVSMLIRRIMIVLIVIAAGGWVIRNIEFSAISRLKLSVIMSDRGMGRLDIWKGFWKAIWDNPLRFLFGYGYGTEGWIGRHFVGETIGAHNVYLEHWATMGIGGLTLLFVMYYRPIITALKRKDSTSFACMVALMIGCLTLGFLSNKGSWNIIMLCLLGLQQYPVQRDE